MVQNAVHGSDPVNQEDHDDQVILSRAEYMALLQNTQNRQDNQNNQNSTRAMDGDDLKTQRRVNDYLRIQADKNRENTDKHLTSIVKDLQQGSYFMLC